MVDLRLGWGAAGPSPARMAFALGRPAPAARRPSRFILRSPRVCAGGRIFFAVRSVTASAREHVLQYAFADEAGAVVASAFARSPSPVALVLAAPVRDEAVAPQGEVPLDEERLGRLVEATCRGASLVAYHRVLQGGLLPSAGLASAAGVECAWRRFQKVARRRGLRLERGEPLSLADCLAHAGLAIPQTEDAAQRALAVRALWRWMDEVE